MNYYYKHMISASLYVVSIYKKTPLRVEVLLSLRRRLLFLPKTPVRLDKNSTACKDLLLWIEKEV